MEEKSAAEVTKDVEKVEETEEKVEEKMEVEDETKTEEKAVDLDRVHIQNIPSFIGFKQFKKMLEKMLGEIKSKKVRHMSDYAYVTFETPEDAQRAIQLINGFEIKKFVLSAHLATTEVKDYRAPVKPEDSDAKPIKVKTAREIVTPFADLEYEKQLVMKQENSLSTMEKLFYQLRKNNVACIGKLAEFKSRLGTVTPAPKTTGYRNKCEFTIGKNLDGEACVGFVGGRFANNEHHVVPPIGVDIVSTHMQAIVKDVDAFVKESGLDTFNEFERVGFWKMLTIREFGGDVMLIFTVFPLEDAEQKKDIQEKVVARFLHENTFTEKQYRVCSIYWQETVHSSDAPNFKHIGGTPYIFESLLDCRFRVSPPAFFQTNSQAASVLYSKIGELCGLEVAEKVETKKDEVSTENDESEPKRMKLEEAEAPEDHGTILLDICCGTGTIGQCLLKNIHKNQKICCVGIEIIPEAIEDAKQNAKQNKMDKYCKYIAGKAEDTFRSMRYHLDREFDLRKSRVVGVLDPPRAGMHEKVILACREMETMKRLVFVSCEPNAAMKNIVDLCRPTSRKFMGIPFSVTKVQPVDMFPQTNHVEWVIQLDR